MKSLRPILRRAAKDPVIKGAVAFASFWSAGVMGYMLFEEQQWETVMADLAEDGQMEAAAPNAYCVRSGAFDPSDEAAMDGLNPLQKMLVRLEHEKEGTVIGDTLIASNAAQGVMRCFRFSQEDTPIRGAYDPKNRVIAFYFPTFAKEMAFGAAQERAEIMATDAEESAHAWQFATREAEDVYYQDYNYADMYVLLQAFEAQAKVIAHLAVLEAMPDAVRRKDDSIYVNGEARLENTVTACFRTSAGRPPEDCLMQGFTRFLWSVNSYQIKHAFTAAVNNGTAEMNPADFARFFGRIPGGHVNFLAGTLDYAKVMSHENPAIHKDVLDTFDQFGNAAAQRRHKKPSA